METSAVISHAAAYAIAGTLRDCGMPVDVAEVKGRPGFTNCTGTQVLAAVLHLVAGGGLIGSELAEQPWLMVSFEESTSGLAGATTWSSLELGWK